MYDAAMVQRIATNSPVDRSGRPRRRMRVAAGDVHAPLIADGDTGNNEIRRRGPWLTALRVLAQSKDLRRDILIERNIDEYLKADTFSLAHALKRLRRAIHDEELAGRKGEDWSVAKNYVRLLLHRMTR
jgi:hypothetical protein